MVVVDFAAAPGAYLLSPSAIGASVTSAHDSFSFLLALAAEAASRVSSSLRSLGTLAKASTTFFGRSGFDDDADELPPFPKLLLLLGGGLLLWSPRSFAVAVVVSSVFCLLP